MVLLYKFDEELGLKVCCGFGFWSKIKEYFDQGYIIQIPAETPEEKERSVAEAKLKNMPINLQRFAGVFPKVRIVDERSSGIPGFIIKCCYAIGRKEHWDETTLEENPDPQRYERPFITGEDLMADIYGDPVPFDYLINIGVLSVDLCILDSSQEDIIEDEFKEDDLRRVQAMNKKTKTDNPDLVVIDPQRMGTITLTDIESLSHTKPFPNPYKKLTLKRKRARMIKETFGCGNFGALIEMTATLNINTPITTQPL